MRASPLQVVALCAAAAAVVSAVGGGASMSAGCSDGSYLFIGSIYDPVRQCVSEPTAIDVMAGSAPAACPAACLVGPSVFADASPMTYVTTMCPPFPVVDDSSGASAGCVAALAAFARGDTCLADGGSLQSAHDAGALDAGSEAGTEAGLDAGTPTDLDAGPDAAQVDATGSDATGD